MLIPQLFLDYQFRLYLRYWDYFSLGRLFLFSLIGQKEEVIEFEEDSLCHQFAEDHKFIRFAHIVLWPWRHLLDWLWFNVDRSLRSQRLSRLWEIWFFVFFLDDNHSLRWRMRILQCYLLLKGKFIPSLLVDATCVLLNY